MVVVEAADELGAVDAVVVIGFVVDAVVGDVDAVVVVVVVVVVDEDSGVTSFNSSPVQQIKATFLSR